MQVFYDVIYKEKVKKSTQNTTVRFDGRDEAYTFANMKQLLQTDPVVIQCICMNDDFSHSYVVNSILVEEK